MAEPSEAQIIAAIEEMTLHRGWIINSFSQVECRLADLINQCQKFPEYEEISSKQLPMSATKRVARVRELMQSGPLANHATELEKLLARFLEFEEVRHLLTHGHASFHFTPHGDMGMIFMRFVPPAKGQKFTEERKLYRLDTIRRQRESSMAFASEAMTVFRQVFLATGLNPDLLSDQRGVTVV